MNQRLATIFLNLSSLHSSPARFNIRFFMNATKRTFFCYIMNAFKKAIKPHQNDASGSRTAGYTDGVCAIL